MPSPITPRARYKGRARDCIIRQLNLTLKTDRMLQAISYGRYSACLRELIAKEYGRLEALGQLDEVREGDKMG